MADTNIKILIVDDFNTSRKIMVKYLSELGYKNIEEVSDGEQAWKLVSDEKNVYGLVLTDWQMPKLSGLDLLKNIRANAKTAKLPVIMVTALKKPDEIKLAMNAKASHFIIKPFEKETFIKTIREVLG